MFRRLFRLRLVPRDVFTRLDELIAAARASGSALEQMRRDVAALTRDMGESGSHRELLRRLGTTQDDLVRRTIADKRLASDVLAHGEDTTARIEALAEELKQIRASLDALNARIEARTDG